MKNIPNFDDYNEMVVLFDRAYNCFLREQIDLIASGVSERTLCGQLMLYIYEEMKQNHRLAEYFVDVEYNRNFHRSKEIRDNRGKAVRIMCDLIVHSRGRILPQDNLIAVEMKKTPPKLDLEIQNDKERLMALTRPSFSPDWKFDGIEFPEYVCRFILGVFVLIDYRNRTVLVQYYSRGKLVHERYEHI